MSIGWSRVLASDNHIGPSFRSPPDLRSRQVSLTRRRLITVLAGLAAAVGLPAFWISRMRSYDGPVSDHFDGEHFFDPDGSPPKSLGEVLRWQFGSGAERAAPAGWGARTTPRLRRVLRATRCGCRSSGTRAG